MKGLERPEFSSLDTFTLPNDDSRVLRGRACLSGSENGYSIERNSQVNWTKYEMRNLYAQSDEKLGDKRPLTGWSDTVNNSPSNFAWNELTKYQVNRIHDLMEINIIRLVK